MSSATTFGRPPISWVRTPDRCILCDCRGTIKRIYNEPDRYQRLIGVKMDVRTWVVCPSCGLMWQMNGLTENDLRDIYSHYRDKEFRMESLRDIFDRVNSLPASESENQYRFLWFDKHIGLTPNIILDVGSGFGVWPALLKKHQWNVTCIEPNPASCQFIRDELGLPCYNSFDLDGVEEKFNVVSLVHVLEHIRHPEDFLGLVKSVLLPNGRLFVEVPDSVEFSSLPIDHDEFNSTHLFFYDVPSLYRLLSRVFDVTDIHRVHYESRGLYRILALCRNIG